MSKELQINHTNKIVNVNVNSEIGKLNGVILHTPGEEVESMTPENAERALYSDIINLSIAREEYKQISGVLGKITNTYQVVHLLEKVLQNEEHKLTVLNRINQIEPVLSKYSPKAPLLNQLMDIESHQLAHLLIEGVEMEKDNLTKFLSDEWFELRPMHNFLFTRDASMSMYNNVLIGRMANSIRQREAVIMRSIFDFIPEFGTQTLSLDSSKAGFSEKATIEGGDFLVARKDILIIGNGMRTSSQGIDMLIYEYLNRKTDYTQHILIQQLPHSPESFIHLDMVFTLLDTNKCMVYKPLILDSNQYKTVHIEIANGKLLKIYEEEHLINALSKIGMPLEPIICGGDDEWNQEREQWHSGANFFCVGPGQVLGYARNNYTIEAMNKAGFDIIKANDIIENKIDITNYKKYVITIDGSELPRGGGGARCMTMPINRDEVIF